MSAPVTVALTTLGCRLNQVESQEMGALLEGRGFRVGARGQPRAGPRGEHLHGDRARRLLRPPDHPPDRPRRPGRLPGRDRLLCPDRSGRRSPPCPAWTSWSAIRRSTGCPTCSTRWSSARGPRWRWPTSARRTLGPGRAGRADDRPVAPLREDPGRLPAPLRLLHRARRARREPEPGAEGRARPGARAGGGRVSGRHADRRRHRPLRLGPLPAHVARGPRAEPRRRRRACAGSASPRCCRPTSPTDLVDAVTTLPVVAPHLHLPLQSGSDRVLRLMRRPYHTGMYRALVDRLAAAIPGLGLGADVIVGHPGRDRRGLRGDARARRARCPSPTCTSSPTRTARAPRPRGAPGHVPAAVDPRAQRSGCGASAARRATPSAARSSARRARSWCCRRGTARPGCWSGLTSNYVEVLFPGPDGLGRRMATVEIAERPRRPDARAPRGGCTRERPARGDGARSRALGVIGGSGLYEMEGIEDLRWVRVRTPFGEPSDQFGTGRLGDRRVIFLPRHGRGHRLSPPRSTSGRTSGGSRRSARAGSSR